MGEMNHRRLIHLALAPLYLAAGIVVFSILSGIPPASALRSGILAFSITIVPAALVVLGVQRNSRRLIRASLIAVILEVLVMGRALSPGRAKDYGVTTLDRAVVKERLQFAAETAYPNVVLRAQAIAAKGARQTGSEGLEQVLQFVQSELAKLGWTKTETGDVSKLGESPQPNTVRRTEFHVLAPLDNGSSITVGGHSTTAYALMPNGVQPCATPKDGITAPLIYLGIGSDEDIEGKDPNGKIAVFEFASGDRWRWAYDRGALGAIFLAPANGIEEATRHADLKYLGLLPINFPRLYVADASVRQDAISGKIATIHSGMTLKTVAAPVLEAVIPGTKSKRELLIMCHADARSIAPALSFGGQEAFGLASWLALFDYFSKHPPAFSLRFALTTGHWQAQAVGREYANAIKEVMGDRIAMTIGVSLNPETSALLLTDETVAECVRPSQYWWLKKLLFTVDRREPGWIDQIEAISDRKAVDRGDTPSKYEFYGGRPTEPGSQWSLWLAPLENWPKTTHAISCPSANQAISQLGCMSVAFKTCNDYCLRAFTCDDRIEHWLDKTENLKPQLELTFALLGALADLDPQQFPHFPAIPWHEWEGYNVADVQVLRWNPSILWYDKTPPENEHTYVMLVPTDSRWAPGKNNAVWTRPMAPSRYIHRLLQCQQTVYMAEVDRNGRAVFPNIYSPGHEIIYNAIALTLDAEGRITHAFDQGLHGDAEFHFLNRKLSGSRTLFQIPTFECGTLVMTSLLNRDRVDISRQAEQEYRHNYSIGTTQDEGEAPFLPVRAINEVTTHTSADSFSWMQYRDTAMIFLKPQQRCEIIAADLARKYVLFNDDANLRAELTEQAKREGISLGELVAKLDSGKSKTTLKTEKAHVFHDPEYLGFRVEAGEERRIVDTTHQSFTQLEQLTRKRMEQYAALNVKSPTADQLESRAESAEKDAQQLRLAGHHAAADAAEALAWSQQSQAYRATYRLLMDVVTTTIFYFLLLLPFGFLVERLLFPQPALARSCVVGAGVFVVFSALLYQFHPGFHLASNIFVTVVSFVIVILTLPALSIVVFRGAAMLKEPGGKFQRRHRADAEHLGVLTAALSLAVNNMRRRKLRTGLTLATITLLVTSLVLLTSTTSDTSFDREKQLTPRVPYRGLQVMNTHDHTHAMNAITAQLLTSRYRESCDIVWRQYFNPGFETTIPCYATHRIGGPSEADFAARRFSVSGAIALDPRESGIAKIDKAIVSGRFFQDGDRRACLLSDDVARRQKLAVGDTVRVLGVDLELVGILRSTDIDASIVDLSGRPLTPQAFYRPALTVDTPDYLLANETIFVPSALVRDELVAPFPIFSVVLVPKPVSNEAIENRVLELREWTAAAAKNGLGSDEQKLISASKGALDSAEAGRLGQPFADSDLKLLAAYNLERLTLKRIAEEIAADHENVDVYATHPAPPWDSSSTDRVELLSAFARVSLQSGSFLVLPFVISFFMLLSIMIGNVYERRSEIQVFSSVGLAPRHVAGMFLAEALVYAGIASVLGYFLGIILLDVFRRAGWLPPDFHANYFGKVVIWSAAMATTSSLLSVLYPMHIASRMVNPSLERVWRIESTPVGNDWRIPLPFVAHDRDEAIGILYFASEFISHHRGERTGAFAVEEDPILEERSSKPVLHGTVWLSPFERDLVQSIAIVPRHDAEKDRYHFDLETTRVSGPDYLWRKSNHAFVDGLRKQILIWRSLDEGSIQEYTRLGLAMIDQR
jgi:ABC-type antimicrobial peptide transport system permease subunit